jgi:hypothetical protein
MKFIVNNHNDYRLFEYENDFSNSNFELGQIVVNEYDEVGVVIQLHADGDCRTDMFGNASLSEVRNATLEEIMLYRNELINNIKK